MGYSGFEDRGAGAGLGANLNIPLPAGSGHEGGYAEAYVPFCGLAVLEGLKGERSAVTDPELDFFMAQQPDERMAKFHRALIDEMVSELGL